MANLECKDAIALMDVFLDGELANQQQSAIAQHLASCVACQGILAARRALGDRMKADLERFAMPASFKARILAELPDEPRPRATWWTKAVWAGMGTGLGAALAASLMLILLPVQHDTMTEELVAAHVRSLMVNHLTDVVSSDQHTVKPWFNGRVDLSPPVPDLSEQGYPLVGGRLDYLHERTVAALVYQRHKHLINLFVWPEPGADRAPYAAQHNGYNVIEWRQGNVAYAIVSDVNAKDIEEFRNLWIDAK